MYEVRTDGRILYYPADDEYMLSAAVVEKNIADAGSFSFTVPPTNPEQGNLKNRSSVITVFEDGKEIFSGELRRMEEDYFKNRKCYAVGELAYLYDTIQPQAVFHDYTPANLLTVFINRHNELCGSKKRFTVGTVNVIDKNDSIYRYSNRESTYQAITEKLTSKLGGYLKVRKENGERYLDWLTAETYGKVCVQPIRFDENLLDYSSTLSGEDIWTACVPLGAHLDESVIEGLDAYVDIKSVNQGKEYIYIPDAVDNFGWAQAVVNFDDVTEPANLLEKGWEWLTNNQYEKLVLNLTAIDLRKLKFDYDEIEVGDYVQVTARPYGLDRLIQVTQMSIDLLDPSKNSFQLGHEEDISMTSIQAKTYQQQSEEIRQKSDYVWSKIENATALITGAKGGYKISEYDSNGKWVRDLYMDMPTRELARYVMQINMNGIGFSTNGYDGPYENAWTIDGNLLADFITAGTMFADRIRGGTLTLGGQNNGNGIMKLLDSAGTQTGIWNNNGMQLAAGVSLMKLHPGSKEGGIILDGNTRYADGVSNSRTSIDHSEIVCFEDYVATSRSTHMDANAFYVWNESGDDVALFGEDTYISSSLYVEGEKNRVVKTKNAGKVKMSAYEMASPLFGDMGDGVIGDDGKSYIFLDAKYIETINTQCEYQVFMQAYGPGSIWVSERNATYFVVTGTPGMKYGWEIKARQCGYEQNRIDAFRNLQKAKQVNYAAIGADYVDSYVKGLVL